MFGEFVGHGAVALAGDAGFVYILDSTLGTSGQTSLNLLWTIGVVDIFVGVMALLRPIRAMLVWAALWGFLTAVVRPVYAGTHLWAFIERFANVGAPLALLFLRGLPVRARDWFD